MAEISDEIVDDIVIVAGEEIIIIVRIIENDHQQLTSIIGKNRHLSI